MAGHAVQVIDYLDGYNRLCEERNQFTISWLRKDLETAIDGGEVPHDFHLNGNQEELRRSRIDDLYLDTVLSPLGTTSFVTRLDLSHNSIGNEGAAGLASFLSTKNKSITTLILKSNSIGEEGCAAIADALLSNNTLQHLNLSYNVVGKQGGMRLASVLQVNTTLQHLNLAGSGLTASPIIALSTVLKNNETVSHLDLSDNIPSGQRGNMGTLLHDVVMHVSSMLKVNKGLVDISLKKLGLGDVEVVEWIAPALKVNKSLIKVDLSCNRIARDGGVSLAFALTSHPSIESFCLSHNAIQDEGAIALAETFQGENGSMTSSPLKRIDLDYNNIGNRGLRAIAGGLTATLGKGGIQHLSLWGNQWDPIACSCFSGLLGARLDPKNVDFQFYEVNGIVHVAHRSSATT